MATETLDTTAPAIAQHLAALEAEVHHIKAQLPTAQMGERPGVIGRTDPQRIAAMAGHLAGDAEAAEVARTIAAEREQEREQARTAEGVWLGD